MISPSLASIEEIVLSYPKLAARIKTDKDRQKVKNDFKEMAGHFSLPVVKTVSKMIDITLAKLYDGVSFESIPNVDFLDLVKNNSLVFVPNHQSHADYIALTYALYNHYKIPIYVAGGINLNVFPIGYMFRHSGCFFIRRSFGSDILYKLTLEAYLYYHLQVGNPLEFFFEGGRSRTGKLLPPRFGFFSMLLDAHEELRKTSQRPLLFIPVSIVHEFVPETKSHAKELRGSEKTAESSKQLLKIFNLFDKKLGSIHIKLGTPIEAKPFTDIKTYTQQMAFDVYRSVGKMMMVTPISILALVLLDEPSGAVTWEQIYDNALKVLKYCRDFQVPMSENLSPEKELKSIKHALNLLVDNRQVDLIKNEKLRKDYYTINNENRPDLLYFKNTILHHFIVPYIISAAWVSVFNNNIKNLDELKIFLLQQRKQLKYEFYLPTVKELITLGLRILGHCTGKKVHSLEEAMDLSARELYQIISTIGVFSRGFNYLFEAYYVSAATLKHLGTKEFTRDVFLKDSKEIFDLELKHGRFIKYSESYAQPILKNSLDFFLNQKVLTKISGSVLQVSDMKLVDQFMEGFARHLLDLLTINLKANSP